MHINKLIGENGNITDKRGWDPLVERMRQQREELKDPWEVFKVW